MELELGLIFGTRFGTRLKTEYGSRTRIETGIFKKKKKKQKFWGKNCVEPDH
jgi:hypothetical protein